MDTSVLDAVAAPAGADVVVEACPEVLAADLQDFKRRMYGADGRHGDPARATWLTGSNPYRRDHEPPVWVARSGDSVVGVQASIPIEFEVGADRCPATWAIDLVVDPEHRGKSIASMLVEAHQQASAVEVAFGLTDGGFATMMRTGATHVGTASAYLFACDSRVVGAKGPRAVRALARLAGSLPVALMGSRVRRAARDTRLVPIESFDASVDDLWRRVSPHYPVIVPRDSRWTRWRFDESPQRDEFERFFVTYREKQIGYVVVRDSTWNGLPTLEIVDYLACPRDVGRLFAATALLARERKQAAVECITLNRRVRHRLRSLGFLNRKGASRAFRVTVRSQVDAPLRDALCEPGAMFLTCADSDVDE